MFIVVVGILLLMAYFISKVTETSSDPKKAGFKLILVVGFVCMILDALCKGIGSIVFILFLVAYGWLKLYD